MDEINIKSVIEALIFATEKPVTLEQIKKALGSQDTQMVRKSIDELKLEYVNLGRGMQIVEVAGGFQMITTTAFSPFLKKLYRQRAPEKLSKPALECLAIIAYKQPLSRSEIGFLRGVNVDGVMKSLVDKNLIRICGRRKISGRPFVYGTTREFLEHFGLRSLEDLPRMEDFNALVEEKEAEIEKLDSSNSSGNDEVLDKVEVKNEPAEVAPEN